MAWREVKDAAEVQDYTLDLSRWLESGDEVASATVTQPAGVTVSNVSHTTSTVTAWVSGGTAKTTYRLPYVATTAAGRVIKRTLYLRIEPL